MAYGQEAIAPLKAEHRSVERLVVDYKDGMPLPGITAFPATRG